MAGRAGTGTLATERGYRAEETPRRLSRLGCNADARDREMLAKRQRWYAANQVRAKWHANGYLKRR